MPKPEKYFDETKALYEEALKLENAQSKQCKDFTKKIAHKLTELQSVNAKAADETDNHQESNGKELMKQQLQIISSHPNFHVKKIDVEIQTNKENDKGANEE